MQVSALNKLAFVTGLLQGQFPEAGEHLADAERLAHQCGDLPGLAEFHTTNCYMTVPFGEFDDAIAHLAEADRIGREQDMDEPRLLGLTHTACTLTYMTRFDEASKVAQESLSHRPVGELTNTGVGAMGLKRGRPVQFHWPLVGPQKGRLPLLVPWGLGPAPRGLATAP